MSAKQRITKFDVITGEISYEEKLVKIIDETKLSRNVESQVVGIHPAYTFQTMEGFGCAMTETACYLLSGMDAETRKEALERWFGPKGIQAKFIRIPIDSCDYSLSEYQAVEDPIADPELKTFSLKRDQQYILPVVKEALALAGGELSVLMSPWSPPAAWKTPPEIAQNDQAVYGGENGRKVDFSAPGRCFGGRLKKEFYGSWAKYLVKFVQAYLEEGIPVTMLSIQNEAAAATNWDSCLWSGEEEATFLKDYLYPEMKKAGLTEKIGIYIWDHNKERMLEHIDEMMEKGVLDLVEGFAYHWYTGDHFEALSMIHSRYPDKVLMHSESCGLHIPGKTLAMDIPLEKMSESEKSCLPPFVQNALKFTPLEVDFQDAMAYAHDMIGDLNHGMQRFIDWNLCVDRNGGPRHVPGGFAAPIVAEDDGTYSCTISYAYILEIAEIVLPGSVIVGTTTYSDKIEAAAVKRPDGSLGVILLNRTKRDQEINLRWQGKLCTVCVPKETLSTILL